MAIIPNRDEPAAAAHSLRPLAFCRPTCCVSAVWRKNQRICTAEKIRDFLHLPIGKAVVAVGALHTLSAKDKIIATFRKDGHALVRGVPMSPIMAEMFGARDGCSRGRGGSIHLFDRPTCFFAGNAIVGDGLPLTVGLVLADKMQGIPGVIACFFGEGAMAECLFHASINLAALWKLPVRFLCENNFYAMATALARSESHADLGAKEASYELPAMWADGMDVIAVHEATKQVAHHVRMDEGPVFVEFQTYRFRQYSMFVFAGVSSC